MRKPFWMSWAGEGKRESDVNGKTTRRVMEEGMENYFDIATEQEIAERFPTDSLRPEWLAQCRASVEKDADWNRALLAGP